MQWGIGELCPKFLLICFRTSCYKRCKFHNHISVTRTAKIFVGIADKWLWNILRQSNLRSVRSPKIWSCGNGSEGTLIQIAGFLKFSWPSEAAQHALRSRFELKLKKSWISLATNKRIFFLVSWSQGVCAGAFACHLVSTMAERRRGGGTSVLPRPLSKLAIVLPCAWTCVWRQ